MKKIFTFLLSIYLLFFSVGFVFAAEDETETKCLCKVAITGTGCEIDDKVTLDIGSTFNLKNTLGRVDSKNCRLLPSVLVGIETGGGFELTKDTCRGISKSGNVYLEQAQYSYYVNCDISGSVESGCVTNKETGEVICTLGNPLGTVKTIPTLIGNVVKGVLGILGSITLFMIVKGGSTWLLASGNEEKIQKGSKTLMWAVVGLVLVLSSYVVTGFIIEFLTRGSL